MTLYLLDTHTLFFWVTKEIISKEFLELMDGQNQKGNLLVSSVSFWELALLSQAKRITIPHIQEWKRDVVEQSGVKVLDPTADDMIESVLLPRHHKDPFDRLLVAQTLRHKASLVTRDDLIKKYNIKTFWM